MDKRIWKFPVPVQDGDVIYEMPEGAQFLAAQRQGVDMQCWWLVEQGAPLDHRVLRIFGTGHPVPDGYAYLATIQYGQFVWHLFEAVAA